MKKLFAALLLSAGFMACGETEATDENTGDTPIDTLAPVIIDTSARADTLNRLGNDTLNTP